MDATDLVRTLFAAVPVHRTLGLTVRRAVDGTAAVAMSTARELTNVIGSLHPTVFAAGSDRGRMTTSAEVTDDGGTVVCHGTFEWSVRRIRQPTGGGSSGRS